MIVYYLIKVKFNIFSLKFVINISLVYASGR